MIRLMLVLVLSCVTLSSATAQERWTLTILHTNDFHSRLQPINRFDVTCSEREAAEGQCFGGTARLVSKVAEIRKVAAARGQGVLLLDAGDQFQGSLLYTYHKGEAELQGMKMVGYDAMAIGNHEFDNGPEVLAPFIRGASTGRPIAVLSANIDASRDRHLRDLVRPYAIFDVMGRKVGVVGLTTDATPTLASPGSDVRFRSPAEAAREAVAALTREGVKQIIVVGHLGLAVDLELAAAVTGIDVVVGGHSHTLLSNSLPGAQGPYPVVATAPDGVQVPIVQAGAVGRYLGRIDVTFDSEGRVIAWTGDTILLDHSVPEDREAVAVIDRLAEPVAALRRRIVGESAQPIDQTRCRAEECEMGNLVADAILWATREQGVEIVLQNGGGLRASMNAGAITYGDVLTVLPFQNTIATLKLSGRDVVEALEIGVAQVERGAGQFPQVAGLRYEFDKRRPGGQRVIKVEVKARDGRFEPIEPDRLYTMATNNFMRRGGDNYAVLRDRAIEPYDFGPNLEVAVMDYMGRHSPLRVVLDGRITAR
jgi:5'-nucleotidase